MATLQHSCLENPMDGGAWWAAVHGVAKSWTWLSDFTFTFHFYTLEKEMATHSSVLAWRIPGMGEPGGLPSTGSHRVGHDWSDLAASSSNSSSASEREVAQSCPTLSNPMDCSPPGSSVHWIFQARVLEWGAIAFSGAQAHAKRGGWTECLAPLSVDPRSPDFTRMALGPLTLHALVFKATWRLKPCVEITCDLNAL